MHPVLPRTKSDHLRSAPFGGVVRGATEAVLVSSRQGGRGWHRAGGWMLRGWALRIVAAILGAPLVGAPLRRWIAHRALRLPATALELLPSAVPTSEPHACRLGEARS